jgi:hypothetical protein
MYYLISTNQKQPGEKEERGSDNMTKHNPKYGPRKFNGKNYDLSGHVHTKTSANYEKKVQQQAGFSVRTKKDNSSKHGKIAIYKRYRG